MEFIISKNVKNQTLYIFLLFYLYEINTFHFKLFSNINIHYIFISYSFSVGIDRIEFNFVFTFMPNNLGSKKIERVRSKER